MAGDHAGGLAALAVALILTNGAIAALHAVSPGASKAVELAVLIAANVLATGIRFLLLRAVIFHSHHLPA